MAKEEKSSVQGVSGEYIDIGAIPSNVALMALPGWEVFMQLLAWSGLNIRCHLQLYMSATIIGWSTNHKRRRIQSIVPALVEVGFMWDISMPIAGDLGGKDIKTTEAMAPPCLKNLESIPVTQYPLAAGHFC